MITRFRPHIIMEIQVKHLVNSGDENKNSYSNDDNKREGLDSNNDIEEGKRRIIDWFQFLVIQLDYQVFYIPWDRIKYSPPENGHYGEWSIG